MMTPNKEEIITTRLALSDLCLSDDIFILELLNTKEWIQFIGDRKIKTIEDAQGYINMILNFHDMHFRVVRLLENDIKIGIVTLIKREYLEFPDLGFAFLPAVSKLGYAYEASQATLNAIKKNHVNSNIHAITIAENTNSIRLLEKLGFGFDKVFRDDNEELQLYTITF